MADMNSKDNWPGFCRAYAKEFNITYAAAISQASPAWHAYKKEQGLKFKHEASTPASAKDYSKGDRVKKLKNSKTATPAPSPYPSTGKDYLMNERAKTQHRKGGGKRLRDVEDSADKSGEDVDMEDEILVGAKKDGRVKKKSTSSTKPPTARKRRKTTPRGGGKGTTASNGFDYSIYSSSGSQHHSPSPHYHPYPYYPPPYSQWGPTPPPPPGWLNPPPAPPPSPPSPSDKNSE